MDHERNDESDKIEEVMLPGFRFHPTDEELVGFYLKRKIQHRPLSIELIKQLDIYKYDPWDLPKIAASGEKEWYFYCPRDRKYRNSARPNRVTGAGFWKATGTDRPIYSSDHGSSQCIGLKKSLVFYKGRAAKGTKTDWMMHEFRLPSTIDSLSSKRYIDRNIPANDAWAICRIFKKTNSAAQRALSHSHWVSQVPEITTSEMLSQHVQSTTSHLSSHNMPLPTLTSSPVHFYSTMNLEKPTSSSFNTPLDVPFFERMASEPSKHTINDASSLLLNMSSSIFGGFGKESGDEGYNIVLGRGHGHTHEDTGRYTDLRGSLGLQATNQHIGGILQDQQCSNFLVNLPDQDILQGHIGHDGVETTLVKGPNVVNLEEQWGNIRSSGGVPYSTSLPLSLPDVWKSNLMWDSSPCLTELSSNYSTNECYT